MGSSLKATARTPRGAFRGDLGHREINVPKRNEAQRQQAAPARTAPLLHHPIVVRLHAQQRERPVFPPQELLAAESGVVREAELGLHSVETHVLQTRLGLPAARTHLVVGDSPQHHVFGWEAGGSDCAFDRGPMIFVAPPGHRRSVGAGSFHVRSPLELRHPTGHVLDMGPCIAQMSGEAAGPHIRRLDDVRIEVHDPRDLVHG